MVASQGRFPLDRRTVHLCVDMQRLFADATPWHVPWMARVLPQVLAIASRHAERTIFTRFVPPCEPHEAKGAWRDYYEQWRDVTRERLDPRLLELVEPLSALVPPARVLDKMVYSAFAEPGLAPALRRNGITALVVTGGETDVCVLAAVLGAVDLGYRTVLVTDALCSSSDETHDALMTLYRSRYGYQIETVTTDVVLEGWR